MSYVAFPKGKEEKFNLCTYKEKKNVYQKNGFSLDATIIT